MPAVVPPPPPTAPPAARSPPRSRSPCPRRGDTRGLCANGCGRPAAIGYPACCRTCTKSGCVSHGPKCQAAWRHANEPPSPVLEPTPRDAPAASSALPAAASPASKDAPAAPSPVLEQTSKATPATSSAAPKWHEDAVLALAKVFCAHCHQRRGNQRCIRCNLHPLCVKCFPMHVCNQRPEEGIPYLPDAGGDSAQPNEVARQDRRR